MSKFEFVSAHELMEREKRSMNQTRNEETDLVDKKSLPEIKIKDKLEKKFPLPDKVTHDLDDIAKAFRDG